MQIQPTSFLTVEGDYIKVPVEHLSPRRRSGGSRARRCKTDVVINNIKLHGFDSAAHPLIVFENVKKPGYYDVLDGNLRLEGIKKRIILGMEITDVPCLVIRAGSYISALKIAEVFNNQVHLAHSSESILQITIKEIEKIHGGANPPLTLPMTSDQKSHLGGLLDRSVGSVNRILTVIRYVVREESRTNPNIFSEGIISFFAAVLESGRYQVLNELAEDGVAYRQYQRVKSTRGKTIKSSLQSRDDDASQAQLPGLSEEKKFTISFDANSDSFETSYINTDAEEVKNILTSYHCDDKSWEDLIKVINAAYFHNIQLEKNKKLSKNKSRTKSAQMIYAANIRLFAEEEEPKTAAVTGEETESAPEIEKND